MNKCATTVNTTTLTNQQITKQVYINNSTNKSNNQQMVLIFPNKKIKPHKGTNTHTHTRVNAHRKTENEIDNNIINNKKN